MIWASPILIYPSSLLYPAILYHSLPIHIYSLLFLFISSVLIPLFVIVLSFSFSFILISTHPILSLLSFYPSSILQSISSYLSFHPPSLLYSLLIHPLIILPIHSFPHPLSPILFSFHPSSISISTPLSFPLLPLSSTYNMAFKSKRSPKRNCVTQLHDYLNKYVTYDSDVCSYELISLSSSIPVKEFSISLLAAEIWKGSLDLGRPSTDSQSLLQIAFISQDN